MAKMRVMITDDHALVREGLRSLLEGEPDIEVVGEATDGEDAVNKAQEIQPDIVLMDITMPGMNGLEATTRIRENNPDIKILVLTMHQSDDYFFKFLDAGASGYFVKGGSSSELITALRAVWKGEVYIHPTMTRKLLSDYMQRVRSGDDKETYDGLTVREREILQNVAEDRSNQEIAELLMISPATVQTHRAHIMAKLGLHSRAELIKYAIRRGFISLDS